MKILHLNYSDSNGGAAKAAKRLHEALLLSHVNTKMLVINKTGLDENTYTPLRNNKIFWRMRKFFIRLSYDYYNPLKKYSDRSKTLYSVSSYSTNNIINTINKLKPDIVHLHWICNEMLDVEALTKIKVPIVWSLHDMWPFTGGCHYDEDCSRYKEICGQCKVLGSNKDKDLSYQVFSRKLKVYKSLKNFNVVGLSSWISKCAEESSLLSHVNLVTLPNPIDTNEFNVVKKKTARELLNLPAEKNLILFGAMSATSDPRKGYLLLKEALRDFDDKNTELVVFGANSSNDLIKISSKINYIGVIHDSITLKLLYNACDVMVVPSRQENLSNAIMESLSCGTPVVAFNIGGNADMIEHKKNGYLAKKDDVHDLFEGIRWVLSSNQDKILSKNARKKILENFDYSIVGTLYLKFYRSLIDRRSRSSTNKSLE